MLHGYIFSVCFHDAHVNLWQLSELYACCRICKVASMYVQSVFPHKVSRTLQSDCVTHRRCAKWNAAEASVCVLMRFQLCPLHCQRLHVCYAIRRQTDRERVVKLIQVRRPHDTCVTRWTGVPSRSSKVLFGVVCASGS